RQSELNKARLLVEAEMVAKGEERIDIEMVKTYAKDLQAMIEEASLTERKAFLRSFIKRIEIGGDKVRVIHKLHLPTGKDKIAVLPIDTFGGPFGTIPELLFEKKQLIPILQQLLISRR
ncbi:hypothetical protein ACFLTZ_05740, partial [Chloroflexota bacterium]